MADDGSVKLYHPDLPGQPIEVTQAAWDEHYRHTPWQKTPPKVQHAKPKAQEPAVAEPAPAEH